MISRWNAIAVAGLVSLAGCAPGIPQPFFGGVPQASPAPQARTALPDPLPHYRLPPVPSRDGVTRYSGRNDGGNIRARLTALPGGRTRVEGGVTGSSSQFCAGSYSGIGTFRGETMSFADESVPDCRMSITRTGRRLSVSDGGGPACLALSGMSCGVSGDMIAQ